MINVLSNVTDHAEGTKLILEQLGWKPSGSSIFIKPNIGATSLWVNTDPNIVRGIIHYLRDLGVTDIVIGEGSVETEYESTQYNFKFCGWDKLADEEDVVLVDLNRCERYEVDWKYGKLRLPDIMKDRVYVNVAKMKTHMQTTVSLCTKNQKGIIDSVARKQFHKLGLTDPIVSLADVIRPELCVVDGVTAVEGDGPGDLGTRRDFGALVAGTDMWEVDVYCCVMMGVNVSDVPHLARLPSSDDCFVSSDNYFIAQAKNIPVANPRFKLASEEFRMFNVHMRPENACSACMSSVGKLNKLARQRMKPKELWFFIRNGVLSRLDFIIGSPEELPEDHGLCVLYGDCTRKVASKHPEYIHLSGCPPNSKSALEVLVNG